MLPAAIKKSPAGAGQVDHGFAVVVGRVPDQRQSKGADPPGPPCVPNTNFIVSGSASRFHNP